MKCTVLPDTNVVIAASIYDVSDVFNTVVVEPHHEESKLLLDALLDADSGCRCVVTPTVASEVQRVARRAATHAVRKNMDMQRAKTAEAKFSEMDSIITKCVNQSSRFLSSMTPYDPPPSLVEARHAEVDKMVEGIETAYTGMLAEQAARQAAGTQIGPAGAARLGADRVLAWPEQDDLAQYERFLRREPLGNTGDKRILAEAATIRNMVDGRSGRFCIASNDTGIFAPLGLRGGRSPARSWTRSRTGSELRAGCRVRSVRCAHRGERAAAGSGAGIGCGLPSCGGGRLTRNRSPSRGGRRADAARGRRASAWRHFWPTGPA